MAIVSISLDKETLSELTRLERELGFSGRSDAVRAAVNALANENESREKLTGKVRSVLLIVHSEQAEGATIPLKHTFEDITSTQIHSNLSSGKCLEIFVLDGDASRIKEMVKSAQANRKIEYAKLVVP